MKKEHISKVGSDILHTLCKILRKKGTPKVCITLFDPHHASGTTVVPRFTVEPVLVESPDRSCEVDSEDLWCSRLTSTLRGTIEDWGLQWLSCWGWWIMFSFFPRSMIWRTLHDAYLMVFFGGPGRSLSIAGCFKSSGLVAVFCTGSQVWEYCHVLCIDIHHLQWLKIIFTRYILAISSSPCGSKKQRTGSIQRRSPKSGVPWNYPFSIGFSINHPAIGLPPWQKEPPPNLIVGFKDVSAAVAGSGWALWVSIFREITCEMGSQLELRTEFPNHMIVDFPPFQSGMIKIDIHRLFGVQQWTEWIFYHLSPHFAMIELQAMVSQIHQ